MELECPLMCLFQDEVCYYERDTRVPLSMEDNLDASMNLLMSNVSLMKSKIILDTGLRARLNEIILIGLMISEDLPTMGSTD